jgi:hypothetical protein
MNSIQRVSVNTHKTMNFTVSKNINRYNVNYTVTNAIAKKKLKAMIQYLRYNLPSLKILTDMI